PLIRHPETGPCRLKAYAFVSRPTCSSSIVRWVWSRLWSFQVQNSRAAERRPLWLRPTPRPTASAAISTAATISHGRDNAQRGGRVFPTGGGFGAARRCCFSRDFRPIVRAFCHELCNRGCTTVCRLCT